MKAQENVLPLDSPGRTLVRSNRNVGTILVDEGKLTAAEADKVMLLQQSHGMRFGEAAMHLRLISQEDLQRALAKQYDFHYLEPGTEDVSREVLAAFNPYHPRVEEMRALRTQLMIRWYNPQTGNRALAIVSPGSQEGRSYVAANLAVLFAQLGHRTLLVDADLRNPRQHLLFNLSDRIGLSAVLSGRAGPGAATAIAGMNLLKVMPAGPTPPNPQELLSRGGFAALLKESETDYDIVIVDTPPAGPFADVQSIAYRTGSALMLARRNHTRIGDAAEVARELADCGIRIVGTVMNVF
jgi:receptor protein-tyrosine kinase